MALISDSWFSMEASRLNNKEVKNEDDDDDNDLINSTENDSDDDDDNSANIVRHSMCSHCNKTFVSAENLNKHIRNVHKIDRVAQGTIQCCKQHCSFSCTDIRHLHDHLKTSHHFEIEEEKLRFTSLDCL